MRGAEKSPSYTRAEVKKMKETKEIEAKGEKPEFRLVQPETDAAGNKRFLSVGGIWRNTSKNGKEFYVVKIGKMKLLAFRNEAE